MRSTQEWLSYLLGATESIGGSLDLQQVAAGFVAAAVPRLADGAAVFVSDHLLRDDAGAPPARGLGGGVTLVAAAGERGGHGQIAPLSGWLTLAAQGSVAPVSLPELEGDESSGVLVPLRVRGTILGFAVWIRRAGSFGETELLLAGQLAVQAALSMHNAYLYQREVAVVDMLQHDMLAGKPPDLHGIEIAHRYLPGSPAAQVGGDWFDTIRLRGGRVALIVGDVTGHGIRSAAAMGRLRAAMRTLAALDLPPGEVLRNLDNIALGEDGTMATCLYCVYDPVARQCSVANAGHIPPVLRVRGEPPRLLDIPAGGPIGVGGISFQTVDVTVPDGSLMVLYTDGLVESRGRDLEEGLTALSRAIAALPADDGLEQWCDVLLDTLGARHRDDDVTVLAARLVGIPADHVANWILTPSPRTPRIVRGLVRKVLEKWDLSENAELAVLLTHELVANAIRYARRPLSVRLMLTDSLLCEVQDDDHHLPVLGNPCPADETGRGILLVSRLARRWGTSRLPTGKVVWFEV
jgi:serine phosphatase RsbU (regulator of sigma subunit)